MKKLITTLISLIFTLNVASQHEIIISEEKVFKQSFKSRGSIKYTMKLVKFEDSKMTKLYLINTDSSSIDSMLADLNIFLELAKRKFNLENLNKIECSIKFKETPILKDTPNHNLMKIESQDLKNNYFLNSLSKTLEKFNKQLNNYSCQNEVNNKNQNYSSIFLRLKKVN